MESDESLNQSAFLHSFSEYSDDAGTIMNVFEENKPSYSPMAKSINKLTDYKIKKQEPLSNVISVAELLNAQAKPTVKLPSDRTVLKKKIADAL